MKPKPENRGQRYKGMEASERAEERRRKFLMAGLEAFGVRGYAATGIRALCREAGLTERYFYESFDSKEDLLCAVYRMIVEEQKNDFITVLADASTTPREKVAAGLRAFFGTLRDDPRKARVQLFEVLGVSPRVDHEYLAAMQMMSELVSRLMGELVPAMHNKGATAWIIPAGVTGALVHVAMRWVLNGYDAPLDELVARMTRVFVSRNDYR